MSTKQDICVLPCFQCEKKFNSIQALNVHLKFQHKDVKQYHCKYSGCCRRFSLWNSFRKHLAGVHDIPFHSVSESGVVASNPTNDLLSDSTNEAVPSELPSLPERDSPELSDDVTCHSFSASEFKCMMQDAASQLVAKVSSKAGLPRNVVDSFIQDVTSFLSSDFMLYLQEHVLKSVSDGSDNIKADIQSAFESLSNPFENLETEFKRFQHFQACGNYIPPESYDISNRPERVLSGQGGTKIRMRAVQGQYIPLDKVLKKFMELPNVYDDCQAYVKSLDNEEMMSSFLQSSIWKRKRSKFSDNDIVLPVHVYFDEYEPNNPLGPHCEKLGAVYIVLPFLPPESQSKAENILLVLLFNAADRENYGNESVFAPLIEMLTKLETEGVTVELLDGRVILIYFVIGLLLGDNLGINGACGFVECFTANHPCRICRVHKAELVYMFEENPNLLRTPANYLEDVNLDSSTETGIKEMCVFSKIPSFECPTDIAVDCFHDTDEGISHYIMIPVLLHFHKYVPRFIEILNSRMYMIDLGVDSDNRPPSIDIEKLKKASKLKMTGSEMKLFVHIFGVLVVDLIPPDDAFYGMYLLLHDIVTITHAKVIPKQSSVMLGVLVKELNRLYVHLTGQTLKFKHHVVEHYPGLLEDIGPYGWLSTIRPEAKHKSLKATSNVCVCRKNLSKTVCIKQQLNLCYKFMCNEPIDSPFVVGPGQLFNLNNHDRFENFKRSLPSILLSESEPVLCSRWVDFKGTRYKVKDVVITSYSDLGLPIFGTIEIILPQPSSAELYFVCSPLCTIGYYSEVRSYQVENVKEYSALWFCINQKDLVDFLPLTPLNTGCGETVINVKSFL